MTATTTRHIELRAGESLLVAGCRITLIQKSGQRARISVQAAPGLDVVHPVPPSYQQPRAHECASSHEGATHGKHPL